MFFSRVQVAPEGMSPKALKALLTGNAYGNHQLLWSLFPGVREGRPFLFRQEFERESQDVDSEEPRGLPLFYVLSHREPEPVPDLLKPDVKPFRPVLSEGQELVFRLRANPVVARRDPGRKNSRRHDVLFDAKRKAREEGIKDRVEIQERMDEAARRWLQDPERAERNGYELLVEPQVSGYRQHAYRRKGGEIRFSTVDYEGRLSVTDPNRFQSTLAGGIGHGRAFGCGLWMVRPG